MQSTRGSRDLRPDLSGIDSSDGDSDNDGFVSQLRSLEAQIDSAPSEQQSLMTGQTFYLNHSLLEQSNEAENI